VEFCTGEKPLSFPYFARYIKSRKAINDGKSYQHISEAIDLCLKQRIDSEVRWVVSSRAGVEHQACVGARDLMDYQGYERKTAGFHTQHNEFDCWQVSIKNALFELSRRLNDPEIDSFSVTRISNCIGHAPKIPPIPELFEKAIGKLLMGAGLRVEIDYGTKVTIDALKATLGRKHTSLPLVTLSLDYRTEYGFRVEPPPMLPDGKPVALDHVVLVVDVTDTDVWLFDPYIDRAKRSSRFTDPGGRFGRIAFEDYWANAYRRNWYMRIVRSKTPRLEKYVEVES
jgi:hypothetical protein